MTTMDMEVLKTLLAIWLGGTCFAGGLYGLMYWGMDIYESITGKKIENYFPDWKA